MNSLIIYECIVGMPLRNRQDASYQQNTSDTKDTSLNIQKDTSSTSDQQITENQQILNKILKL
jgi:hypothetical protein